MDLADKHTIITGGASGIGAATAREFARLGAQVVVADINGDGANAVAQEVGGTAVACNVANEADVNALVAEAERQYGPVDLFFSNAGVATGSTPLETPIDVWNEQWQINVMAHVFAVRAVLPSMLERESGYLLHTASMAGILTTHGNLTYATTKHAVVGLAEWLSITYHDKGIRTSLLAPLGVRTPMLRSSVSGFRENAAGPVKETRRRRADGRRSGVRGTLPDSHRPRRGNLDDAQGERPRALAERHAAAASQDRRGRAARLGASLARRESRRTARRPRAASSSMLAHSPTGVRKSGSVVKMDASQERQRGYASDRRGAGADGRR